MRKVAALAAVRRRAACEAKIASPLLLRSPSEVNPQNAAKFNLPIQTRGFAAEPAPEPAAESTQLTDKTGSKMGSVKAVSLPARGQKFNAVIHERNQGFQHRKRPLKARFLVICQHTQFPILSVFPYPKHITKEA